MFGLQSTLEIARRALRAHQMTIGVLGNNIANVETPGFSRRRVELSPAMEVLTGVGGIGTGVDVIGVSRARDRALDGLYRGHTNTAGRWGAMRETLSRVETAFPANDEGGLGKSLTEFYASWNDLANQPENRAAACARGRLFSGADRPGADSARPRSRHFRVAGKHLADHLEQHPQRREPAVHHSALQPRRHDGGLQSKLPE